MSPARLANALHAVAILWAMVAGAAPAAATEDALLLDQGRAIYERGEGLDPITARLAGDLEVDGSAMPCAGCHGRDGGGGEESGYSPTPLHWTGLTRPYEVSTPSGRAHGPYTRGLLKRAISLGLDPSGNELLNIMPRYTMSLRDLDALAGYIQTLERPRAASTLRIALPRLATGPARALEDAGAATTRAALEQLNQQGGLYGRSVEVHEFLIPADATAGTLRAELDRIQPLALLAGLLPYARDAAGADTASGALVDALQQSGIPWIGPLALAAMDHGPVFLLEADLTSQTRALASWALEQDAEPGPWWIVVADDPGLSGVADEVQSLLQTRGVIARRVPAADLTGGAIPPDTTIVLLAPAKAVQPALTPPPAVRRWLQPAALTDTALVETLGARLVLAGPNWPLRRQLPAWDELRRLDPSGAMGIDHLGARMSAIAAVRVLVHVLSRSGRNASPETLIEELEDLHQFDAGIGRPISFGAGRREANPGAFIFRPDLAEAPEWRPAR